MHRRLIRQGDALARHDVGAGLGSDDDIHGMRVACRRLRSLLASFRPVFDEEQTEPVRAEIRWIAGVLGEARDASVVQENLLRLVDAEPPELVEGPVRARLQATYDDHAKPALRDALASPRYLQLLTSLDPLVLGPPWSALAGAPVRQVAPLVLRREVKRFDKRVRAAAEDRHDAAALHEVRKAAKRLRYAAETLRPVLGPSAKRLGRAAKTVTIDLGELQDTAVSRVELLALAEAASRAGEPTGTYGRLQDRLEIKAGQLAASFWAGDALAVLDARCRDAIHELGSH